MKIDGINLFELCELLKLAGKGDFVISSWKGKRYFRRYVKPKNPRTKKQREQREKFSKAVEEWHKSSKEEREVYNKLAKELGENVTGLNLFVSDYLKSTKFTSNPYQIRIKSVPKPY